MPIRPPLLENATITLEKTIKQYLDYYQRGVFTDTQTAEQIAYAFDYVRYPTVPEILDVIDLIPEPMRKLILARIEE